MSVIFHRNAKNLSIFLFLLAFSTFSLSCESGNNLKAQAGDAQLSAKDRNFGPQDYRIVSPVLPQSLTFAGEVVPLQMFYIKEFLERELLVNMYWHSSTLLNLKRAHRWFPVIEPILKANGIPDDFKYLCMIESNLSNIKSPAGASGFWQFMESTAKEYGLLLNADIDERYYVEKATQAACSYLNKAFAKYNSWALVAAAYNAGTKRIDGFLNEQNANSYFDLLMAEETERYVYRILAMKLIHAQPEEYGFFLDGELYEPFIYKTFVATKSIDNLAAFAAKEGISYKLLKIFNPWLRSNKLPIIGNETYVIKLPLAPFNLTDRPFGSASNSE